MPWLSARSVKYPLTPDIDVSVLLVRDEPPRCLPMCMLLGHLEVLVSRAEDRSSDKKVDLDPAQVSGNIPLATQSRVKRSNRYKSVGTHGGFLEIKT